MSRAGTQTRVRDGSGAADQPRLARRWVRTAVLASFLHFVLAAGPVSAMPVVTSEAAAAPVLPVEIDRSGHGVLSSGSVDEVTLTIGPMLGAIFFLVGLRVIRGEINLQRAPVTLDDVAGHVLDL